jgi:hypothetical protein
MAPLSRPRRRVAFIPRSVVSAAVIGLFVACCASPTEPAPYTLPAPDTSLDPAHLVNETLLYGCGRWFGTPLVDTAVLADVSWGRASLDDPGDAPTASQRAIVENAGGFILYNFHFHAMRIWIPTARMASLYAAMPAPDASILAVPNPRRFDWLVIVTYKNAYHFTAQDESTFVHLGGRIEYVFGPSNGIGGHIPDRSVPALRADPHVLVVEGEPPWAACSG